MPDPPVVIVFPFPRAAADALLKDKGLGGLSALPRKAALYFGAAVMPAAVQRLAQNMADPAFTIVLNVECGDVAMRFEIR